MTIETTSPEWEDFDLERFDRPERTVIAGKGDYTKYLESRIPPLVRVRPHWCAKNLTAVELEPLVSIATGSINSKLKNALYAHPSLLASLEQFPDEFLTSLQSAESATLKTISEKWAAEMSTPDYTHSMGGDRISDDWTAEDALSIIMAVLELARKVKSGQSMYLLLEG